MVRIYTAAGEAADLHEMLGTEGIEFFEIADLDELGAVENPAVLFLSRGLLGGGGTHEALNALPAHIVVVAADDGARSAADQADRLFLAGPDLAPGQAPLLRALRSASRHADAEAERAGVGGPVELGRLQRGIEQLVAELGRSLAEGDADPAADLVEQLTRLSADLGQMIELVREQHETPVSTGDVDGADATGAPSSG